MFKKLQYNIITKNNILLTYTLEKILVYSFKRQKKQQVFKNNY